MKGKLYGISVGPGESTLMTLKAFRTLQELSWISFLVTSSENHMALDIISKEIDLEHKKLLPLKTKMTRNLDIRNRVHLENCKRIEKVLLSGEDVGFITIGDISVYSTFSYLSDYFIERDYEVEWIPGVTSFCAASCKNRRSLTGIDTKITIFPPDSELPSDLTGTKICMKHGSKFTETKQKVLESYPNHEIYFYEMVGHENERIQELNEVNDSSYFSLIIAKEI